MRGANMDEKFEEYKKNFINQHCCYNEEISYEEYCKLDDTTKKEYEKNSSLDGTSGYYADEYYKHIPYNFSNSDELKLYLEMKSYEKNIKMQKSLEFMKNTMTFWLVLTIINLIGVIYMAVKISDFVGR